MPFRSHIPLRRRIMEWMLVATSLVLLWLIILAIDGRASAQIADAMKTSVCHQWRGGETGHRHRHARHALGLGDVVHLRTADDLRCGGSHPVGGDEPRVQVAMSLILAIEPNKNQAHQLNALVRQYLKAELVTAPTAAAALAALGDRIPDLVLTPALFGLRDEAALTERLRQLGTDGSHVQTLAIPILGGSLARQREQHPARSQEGKGRRERRLRPGHLRRTDQNLSAARLGRAPGPGQRSGGPGNERGPQRLPTNQRASDAVGVHGGR